MTVTCFSRYCREAVENRWMCSEGFDAQIRFALPGFVSGRIPPELVHPICAVAYDIKGFNPVKNACHTMWIGAKVLGLSDESAVLVFHAANSFEELDSDPRILEVRSILEEQLKLAKPSKLIEAWSERKFWNN